MMINTSEILKSLHEKRINGSKRVLIENENLRIVHSPSYLELECLGEREVSRRDLSSLAIFLKKYFKLSHNHKILIPISKAWRLDPGVWDLITKPGFFGKFTVAFVSTELHQTLLLRNLEKLEFNLRTFNSKRNAEEWLYTQHKNQTS